MFQTNVVKLDLDCTQARSWCEIDCVLLRGLRFVEWSTEKHKEFPPLFKNMVITFLLINQRHQGTRMWLPKVMLHEIFNHCALSWPSEEGIKQERIERERVEGLMKDAEAKREEKFKARMSVLQELLKDGTISKEVYQHKKQESFCSTYKAMLEQMKNDGLIAEHELVAKMSELALV